MLRRARTKKRDSLTVIRPNRATSPAHRPLEPWRRNQIAITVAAAMIFLGFTLVTPFIPFYIRSLGLKDDAAVALWSGLLLSITPLLAALLGPWWGRLADRIGLKIMIQRVLFAMTLHWGLMFFTTEVWHVLVLRIFLGLFSGFGTMSVALVTQGCPKESIGRAVGMLRATQILSTAAGPFLGGFLAQTIGIRHTYLITSALCAGGIVLVTRLYRNVETEGTGAEDDDEAPVVVSRTGLVAEGVQAVVPQGRPAERDGRWSFRRILALPGFVALMPLLFLINFLDRSFFLIVPLYLTSLKAGGNAVEAATGIVLSAEALAAAASSYMFGRACARASPMRLLRWSLLGGTLLALPMGLCRGVLSFAIMLVLLGLAVGGAATLVYTIAGELIPDGVRASSYATLSSIALLGGALGPSLAGLLSAVDPRAPLLASGLVYLGLTLRVSTQMRRSRIHAADSARPRSHGEGEDPQLPVKEPDVGIRNQTG